MTSRRLRHLGATFAGAALMTASASLMASSAQEPGTAQRPPVKADAGQPSPDDQVEALVRQYDDARAVLLSRPANPEVFRADSMDREKMLEESRKITALRRDVTSRLLELAGRHPRTNAAEQALTWIVCTGRPQFEQNPEADRALEILARDHIRSDRIKAVLAEASSVSSWASPTTENLLRRALETSPYYEIRGLACYRLAELLTERAERVRIWELLGSPPQGHDRLLRGGPEVVHLLRRCDPDRLEAEAATLLERVVAGFPRVVENHNGSNRVGTFLEAPAKSDLDRLRRLSIGKPAPEITGVDLDGKPMKLNEYRGKVVLLYFSPFFSLYGDREPSLMSDGFRKLSTAFAGRPFAIVGVVNWNLDAYRKEHRAGRLPGRFWVDGPTRDRMAGSIHSAWDVTGQSSVPTYYVLDPRGTIRYNLPGNPGLIEKAVAKTLEESAPGATKR